MTSAQDKATVGRLVAMMEQLLKERSEASALVEAFRRGELDHEQVVSRLASHFQKGIGAAARDLAEANRDAGQALGELLRDRVDHLLSELADRAAPPASRRARPRASADDFKDRDDKVLLREYAIIRALARGNPPTRSAELFEAVKALEPDVTDEAVTAHLTRLFNSGVIGKQSKGRYHATPASQTHFAALQGAIEARGLRLPS